MKNNAISWITMSLLALAGACGGDDPVQVSPGEDACEHMIEGPIQSLTAAADAGTDAPDIGEEHVRSDILLVEAGALKGGVVDLVIPDAGEHTLYLNTDVPIAVLDGTGAEVAAVATESSVDACAEVSLGHTFDLGVGTYALTFGPTAEALVQVVVVARGG